MPTYQYECAACGMPLEIVQSFSEDALTKCPECGQEELKKVYGAVGVVFKGSGFYKTDSRNTKPAASPTTAKSTDSKPTDAKTASTTTGSADQSTKTATPTT